MRTRQIILIVSAALGLVGCASNRGGTGEELNAGYGTEAGHGTEITTNNVEELNTSYSEEHAKPLLRASPTPTSRPGMNPQDIRDPVGLTFPEAPPTTPPKPAPENQR